MLCRGWKLPETTALPVFGGSTQFVINRLIAWTGEPLPPAWYMSGATVIGLIGTLLIRERRARTSRDTAHGCAPPAMVPARA